MIPRRIARFTAPALAQFRMCATGPTVAPLPRNSFAHRHIGPCQTETKAMLTAVGAPDLATFVGEIVPESIRRPPPPVDEAMTEPDALRHLRELMSKNKMAKSLIGQGYYETVTPPVILRNVLENPGWYTPYTPYQAEISQGRLEALLNFQTMVSDLTALPVANASLLDEATAAFEAVHLAFHHNKRKKRKVCFVDSRCFPSTIDMIRTRAASLGIEVRVGNVETADLADAALSSIVAQSPDTDGVTHDFTAVFEKARSHGVVSCCGADLLASTLVKPPGEMGADVAFGNAQRFGIPLGYGGPHPAFFACREEFRRLLPGRIIGVTRDATGQLAYRMALQTREQHIKRQNATSNICTAQALLANMAGFYASYHGPDGLTEIARAVHTQARCFALGAAMAGHELVGDAFFDTVTIKLGDALPAAEFAKRCERRRVNINVKGGNTVSVSFDEATRDEHLLVLLESAGLEQPELATLRSLAQQQLAETGVVPTALRRTTSFMAGPAFNAYHSETEMMRYLASLQAKDYGLQHGMVPLGSCTMKLNSAASMLPMTWVRVNNIHPLAPVDQAEGYKLLAIALEKKLCDVSGFDAVSLQPNSGAQGEYSGLRVIKAYLESIGEGHRDVCFIPANAHGTNPASAVLAGFKIVVINCAHDGTVCLDHLAKMCEKHGKNVAAAMITYPSTYGIFDAGIKPLTEMIHAAGGQVYIDGANFNAMLGNTGPAFFGGDVCHFNLHKTFSIPHGGGGPGMGPIGVREHLAPFLPRSSTALGPQVGGSKSFGATSQAAYGSASILTISYMMMTMLGSEGLKRSAEMALLNANYLCRRLHEHYEILFRDPTGHCGHEFIVDLRPFKAVGVEAEDIAKRLMDYGFHAPTLAFPVVGTLMVEPTESESMEELDRFATAMIAIREEIRRVEAGEWPKDNNPLVNAPHPVQVVAADQWDRPYSRELAGYPLPSLKANKQWPTISRVDGEYGDLHLWCTCHPPPSDFLEQ